MRAWSRHLSRQEKLMHGRTAWMVSVALVLASACEKPEPPPVAYIGPVLASNQLSMAEPPAEPATGFVIVEEQSTEGRFPGALAVARLEPPQPVFSTRVIQGDNDSRWWVGTIRWEEAMGWNRLCNTIPEIRETVVMDPYNVVSPPASLAEIAESGRRLDAGLCLIYGPSPAEPDHAGLWGVILDTATGQKVAFIQAQASPRDFQIPRPEQHEKDMRHRDPNYLAECKFQQQVRACALALIAKDRRPTATQPSPWQTDRPQGRPLYIVPERQLKW